MGKRRQQYRSAHTRSQQQREPGVKDVADFTRRVAADALGDEFRKRITEAHVEDAEVSDDSPCNSQNAILRGAQSPDQERYDRYRDYQGRYIADQIPKGAAREQ